MSRFLSYTTILAILACLLAAGCDTPPAPPRTATGDPARALTVSENDPDELAAVTSLEKARVNYEYRLSVLTGYYERVGNADKLTWVRRETRNLQTARTFGWQGLPEIVPPMGETIAGADEQMLAELVVAARQQYLAEMGALADFYESRSQSFKADMVRNAVTRFDPVRTYMYFLPAEIPPADLRPIAVIPEADAMFEQAYRLHRQGKPLPGITDYQKQRKALLMFRELVRDYPQSNKIALAAYYIAEIYKEYFNEDVRSVHWYERAWQWDATITQPARFQAATVYDFRLQNKAKAVQCYRDAIEHEQFNSSNVRFSHQRIRELTGQEYRPGI